MIAAYLKFGVSAVNVPFLYIRYPTTPTLSVEELHVMFICVSEIAAPERFAGVVGGRVSPPAFAGADNGAGDGFTGDASGGGGSGRGVVVATAAVAEAGTGGTETGSGGGGIICAVTVVGDGGKITPPKRSSTPSPMARSINANIT